MTDTRKTDAIVRLRELLPVGSIATTLVVHTTRSGMGRSVRLLIPAGGTVLDVTWLLLPALGLRFDDTHGGVIMRGTGMDMGFHLVYILSQALHGDGYALTHNRI